MMVYNRLHTAVMCLICLVSTASGSLGGGWKWEQPPDKVSVSCGRRNPVFYAGEPVGFTLSGNAATRYEVRDYYGSVVDKGAAKQNLALKVSQPGWYKLYLFGKEDRVSWGRSVGGTMFAIFRKDPHFPSLPPVSLPRFTSDIPTRSITGMGPERHAVQDASKPDEAIAKLEADIEMEAKYYLPYDPVRKRALLVAFPNGTDDLGGVRKIVERFKGVVKYWEPRNEPNFKMSGSEFATKEMKSFYETVKSVDPTLKVLGPGTVTIGPYCLGWIEDFLKAGGDRYIDAFSFHSYNNVNGDLWLARKSMHELNKLLARYGADKLEKWQTEQGFFAPVYGSYQPRLQGRWTMLQAMVNEQYGIPKEHNHYWYDRSHGFWDMPTWWENEDDGLNPAAVLLRVWSEELYGTRFQKAYDLGLVGNKLYIGSLFKGPNGSTAAFMSAGCTDGKIQLLVKGAKSVRTVSAFGISANVPVTNGRASLHVSELPVYVEMKEGQSIEVVPIDWSTNLARLAGVSVSTSVSGAAGLERINNGELENWYYAQGDSPRPWSSGEKTSFPLWVEIKMPSLQKVSKAIIYASPPWQQQSTLLDYELQYEKKGEWVTIEHVSEPARTFSFYTPCVRCTVDTFFSDRWIFIHQFKPVAAQKIRLLIHDATWGGGATKDVNDAGGQTGPRQATLREVELYR